MAKSTWYKPPASLHAAGKGINVDTQREAGKAAFVLGLCFILESAIPFTARDPMRVIPLSMIAGALIGALSMMFSATLMAPQTAGCSCC